MKAQFRYTFPIAKAEERADGVYITGLASGPEIDSDGERVTVEAIANFARQIEDMASDGFPLTYRDAHAKDGVLRDLGVVTKAWITPEFHLGVEVRLDVDDNPAALSLYKQIKKGKLFGMSVAGHVLDFADEYVAEVGKIVRTFKDVVLEEISNTTRPAWYPSFGTVLSKAIKDTAESESDSAAGENVEDELQTEQETTETPAVDETTEVEAPAEETVTEETAAEGAEEVTEEAEEADETETEATEEAADDTTEEPAAEEAEGAAEEAAEETTEEVEEPAEEEAEEPAAENDVVAQMRAALATFHTNLTEMLTGMGVEMTPVLVTKSVSTDENEPTIEKAVQDATAGLQGQIEDLQKSLNEATARIEELENSPAGDDAPGLVEKHALSVDEVAKAMEDMTPGERLRLGLRFGVKPSRE